MPAAADPSLTMRNAPNQLVGAASRHCFDAADASRGRSLADDEERADVRGAVEMRAAAEFVGVFTMLSSS